MKILYLIRHAKSSWEFDVEDYKRPLKQRGKNDIKLICDSSLLNPMIPDLIISSSAERAKQTAHLFIRNLDLSAVDFQLNKNLYDFAGDELTKVIKSCDDAVDKLLVFGHNYAITNFVNNYGDLDIYNVPTSGFVEIHFKINSWKALKKGLTVKTVFPKDLKSS